MRRRARQLELGELLVGLWLAALAWAGTTGKVAGTTTDANGVPLPGVALTVEDSRLGATSDANGQYVILQVPPGQHTVTAQLVGYRPTSVTAVRVSADRTTQVNFTLHEQAIEVEAMVVTAERPPIEADVTSSQRTVDAASVAEAPVSKMLDILNYEPGVAVNANNQLEIRGGGPSEVRFRVDGMDRTDASTGNSFTQLNQTLVSEVTVLTGGFNAEYGNVRSGVVNAVMKDGTERGVGTPWVSAVSTLAPAQRKHFGPSAYGEDQYNYRVALLSDSASGYAPIYWPDLYEATRTAPEFTDPTNSKYRDPHLTLFKVFDGWTSRAAATNALGIRKGAYGKKDWTPKEAREAWQWEANMNEQVWGYSNEPDRSLDASAGWGLPRKLGGLVVGYRYDKQMTAVPALRPYSLDQSLEGKLTLTPTDNFKIAVSFVRGETHSTGAAGGGYNNDSELGATNGQAGIGGDPMPLRGGSGDLISGINGAKGTGNNPLNLSYNGFLGGTYAQYGTSITYTFSARTFATAGMSWSHTAWDLSRDLPRVNIDDFSSSAYRPPTAFNYRDWLVKAFYWSDVDGNGVADLPASLEDALTPGRVIFTDKFSVPDVNDHVPSKAVYITKRMPFVGTDGKPDTATVVSPQGWLQEGYYDLSGQFWLGEGGEVARNGQADQIEAGVNITHAAGSHTLKSGLELIRGDLEYHSIEALRVMGTRTNACFRDYGGHWPAARPMVVGVYFQDKLESFGMISNFGVRIERFDGGQNGYMANRIFDAPAINFLMGKAIFDSLAIARGWDVTTLGPVPALNLAGYARIKARLGDEVPMPWDVIAAYPQKDNVVYWRAMPRFGISHPVSQRTKCFFNYGIFYSMQKPAVMYSIGTQGGRTGKSDTIRLGQVYNPSLRPAKTTMYEVGVEHVLPLGLLTTVRGYAKYNVDQVSTVTVEPPTGNGYAVYRNSNYENIRGIEIRLSRSGRFLSGFVTAERFASRAGQTGLQTVRQTNSTYFTAFVNANQPQFTFEGLLHLGTPAEWGQLTGGWGVSIVQSYTGPGGEAIYNPNNLERRDIPDENILSYVASYQTNLKLSKRFSIGRWRQLSAYVDVTNLFNKKSLSMMPQEYLAYIVQERRTNKSLKLGDSSTFHVFTEPYKDATGNWLPPIAPSMDWLLFMYPRAYRLGVSVDL